MMLLHLKAQPHAFSPAISGIWAVVDWISVAAVWERVDPVNSRTRPEHDLRFRFRLCRAGVTPGVGK